MWLFVVEVDLLSEYSMQCGRYCRSCHSRAQVLFDHWEVHGAMIGDNIMSTAIHYLFLIIFIGVHTIYFYAKLHYRQTTFVLKCLTALTKH